MHLQTEFDVSGNYKSKGKPFQMITMCVYIHMYMYSCTYIMYMHMYMMYACMLR